METNHQRLVDDWVFDGHDPSLIHLQLFFNKLNDCHFVLNVSDHFLFYLNAHSVPAVFEYILSLVYFFNPIFVVAVPLIKVALLRYGQG